MSREEPAEEELFEEELYAWERPGFHPVISEIPKDCNTVTIALNGKYDSDLDWKKEKEQAEQYITEGFFLFWKLDLGLFDQLKQPLGHQGQFLTISLAIQHFREQIWEKYKEFSLGISIYEGGINFYDFVRWEEMEQTSLSDWLSRGYNSIAQLNADCGLSLKDFSQAVPETLMQTEHGRQLLRFFALELINQYLDFVIEFLPERLPCYLLLDAELAASRTELARLLSGQRFELFRLAIKNNLLPSRHLTWSQNIIYQETNTEIVELGVCLPDISKIDKKSHEGFEKLFFELKQPYKLISEEHLVTEWDNIEFLFVVPASITSEGRRKLQGFCAAGGTVVTIAEGSLGLAYEMSYSDWLKALQ